MDVRIKFLGGAETVTGSKYLLEIDDFNLLVDCGLFQGKKELRVRNWEDFPIDANTIDAIILTHAHIDHSGYLPKIVNQGFSGPIYCTDATASLLEIMLRDAAKLQEEEAEYARKKGYSKHDPPKPLFTTEDAEKASHQLKNLPYKKQFEVTPGIKALFKDAGHILGSAIVQLSLSGETQNKELVFSGDLGRYNQPLLHDPSAIEQADILLLESTYGDRINMPNEVEKQLAQIVNDTFSNGGCVLIPSFAVGRTQLLLYYFHYLLENKMIPSCKVFIDSPMAISATQIHKKHREDHKLSVGRNEHESIFEDAHFHYYRTQESSMDLSTVNENAIIISASGMCTGGRILHHLYHRLPRKQDTLLFVGYQADGTRGRRIVDGESSVRIFGLDVEVKCNVQQIEGLSAHADKAELLRWAENFQSSPKMTFIVHGEIESAKHLANTLTEQLDWPNVIVPQYLESFELFQSI